MTNFIQLTKGKTTIINMATIQSNQWMAELATHYQTLRTEFPDDQLMIVFDIDGTILDMRHMVVNTLRAFDIAHHTRLFHQLKLDDITMHENHVEDFIWQLRLTVDEKKYIHNWYLKNRWSKAFIVNFHQAYAGVFDVIRWFQTQHNTHVGLNTGRPEIIRRATLNSLNRLGAEHGVQFTNEHLYMKLGDWEHKTEEAKQAGLNYFMEVGYHVASFIDNEPANLRAVSQIADAHNILLLHADTLFETPIQSLPKQAVVGNHYDVQPFQQIYLR